MSQDVYRDNLDVPPQVPNFDEYLLPEGDVVEKMQAATHIYRAKLASLREYKDQLLEKKAEIEFALERIDRQLRD
jgi:hypothetical protein